jgi:hypothetical protein
LRQARQQSAARGGTTRCSSRAAARATNESPAESEGGRSPNVKASRTESERICAAPPPRAAPRCAATSRCASAAPLPRAAPQPRAAPVPPRAAPPSAAPTTSCCGGATAPAARARAMVPHSRQRAFFKLALALPVTSRCAATRCANTTRCGAATTPCGATDPTARTRGHGTHHAHDHAPSSNLQSRLPAVSGAKRRHR